MSADREIGVGEVVASHRLADASVTRERILTAAEGLFAAAGFDGTSTARIAREADVPKGLLFYYFPTKSGILSALLRERLSGHDVDAVDLGVAGDPQAGLMNVARWTRASHEASDVLREILWRESHTRAEVHRALTAYRHALHTTIVQVLRMGLTAPVPDSALHATAAAWAATITARPLEGAGGAERGDLHDMQTLEAIASVLCAGLRAQVR